MKKGKENGYFKFYTATGLSCRIKSSGNIRGKILIRMQDTNATSDSNWLFYSPGRSFENCLDAANYILKNLEKENMVFKISSMSSSL